MRLSYLAQDRLDLAETAKHLAQRMSVPREFDFVPLKRAARYLVGKPKAALRFRRQKRADKITVFVDSDFDGNPVSRKSRTGLVTQIGNHTVKSGSTLQSLTALSVGEAGFYAVVKGCQVGVSLRCVYQDLGIPVKVEIKVRDRRRILRWIDWEQDSERNTLTRGTFGYKNECKTEIWCLQRRTVQMLERGQSLLQYNNNIVSLQDWSSTDHRSHTPLQDDGDEPMMDLVNGSSDIDTKTWRHEHRNTTLIVNIETDVQAE